ncbi:hypothetical protein BDQ17DRAFT_1242844, partial [Cyathus striatus]
LPGGWIMVVMERLDSHLWKTLHDSLLKNVHVRSTLKKDIKGVLEKLHENNMVHGDIRDVNIMVNIGPRASNVMFLDFDWAGSLGKATYPPYVNTHEDLNRPREVCYGFPILPAHDMYICENLKLDD